MLSYEEVKELARKKGFSLRELAEKTGYEFSGFYKALNRKSIKYEARVVLAKTLGLTMEELQGEVLIESHFLNYNRSSAMMHIPESSESEKPYEESSNIMLSKNANYIKDNFQSLNSDYRFLIDSLKEQIQSKSELIKIQNKMIEDLKEKVQKSLKENQE